ncbi:WASH complex subunit 5-like isoform X1 [Lycorma delicatula]|uniref:WASH complex subunit 5-like isoform X1 n=1 Tax=Lycorma delicatula TaxID=130591 RepID=UPI003F5185DA
MAELQNFLSTLQKGILRDKAWIDNLSAAAKVLSPNTANISNPTRMYPQISSKLQKTWPQYLDCVLRVGQLQLLRKHIFYELRTSCKFESKPLASAFETMNRALLNEIRQHYKLKGSKPAQNDSNLLVELTTYLDWAGIGNPFAKIYVTTKNLTYFPLLSFLFVISQLPKMTLDKNIGLVWKKSGDPLDGIPFVVGLQTLFRHFHPEVRSQLLLYLGQYVNSFIEASISSGMKSSDLPAEVTVTIHFCEKFHKVFWASTFYTY